MNLKHVGSIVFEEPCNPDELERKRFPLARKGGISQNQFHCVPQAWRTGKFRVNLVELPFVYRVIEKIPEITEALVIDTTKLQQGAIPGWLLLFVVLSSGRDFNEELRQTICAHLRAELSPRYVPDAIFPVPEIPHTLNGKKLEVPVKRLFEGTSLAKAISREAVANPGSLQYFANLAARLQEEVSE